MKKIRSIIEVASIRFCTWLMPKLSRTTILNFSRVLGILAYFVDYKGRPTAHENLRVAFAKENISPSQIRRIAMGSYQTFARTFLDLFWSLSLNKENYTRFVDIQFVSPQSEAEAKARGSIWVTPHFGNFELVGLGMSFRGFPLVVVAQDFKNPQLTTIFKQLRGGGGSMIIPQQGAMLRLMKELKRQGHVALLTDLNIKPSKLAEVIDCFGLKTCGTILHTSLATRLKLPVIPSTCLPMSDGGYRATMHPHLEPSDFKTPGEMAQAVWNCFEKEIRKTPEAWLWMYKHWRYLPKDVERSTYPDYANPNKDFRAMQA